jgi:hypothetical protein
MTSMSGYQNVRASWVSNAKPPPYVDSNGFGAAKPVLPMWASTNKPSDQCRDCEHTLVCTAMTVYAYSCPKCGIRALWVAELETWLWPQEAFCAHEAVHCGELCYTCKANEEALKTLRERKEQQPRTITTTGTTAGPLTYPTIGTTTGDKIW